jgi:structural maintenance of chromosome 1
LDSDIEQVKQVLALVEDDVFGEFCSSIGVTTIRQYEELQFTLPDQVREQNAKYTTQRTRLQTQHSFEKQELESIQERLAKLTQSLHDSEQAQLRQQAELVSLDELRQKLTNDLVVYESELQTQIQLEQGKQQELDELRLLLEEKGRDMDAYLKEMTSVESSIEKIRAERVAIFRKCKLEDINLPLIRGTMDDVLIDDSAMSSVSEKKKDSDRY